MGEVSRKVEGGKLVKIRVDTDNGDGVTILGDFFMHPEDRVEGLEKVVLEKVDSDVDEIEEAVRGYISEEDVELVGISSRDIAEVVVEARAS
ncbi:MAG: hypothetical protein SXQ77_01835 [Halobacteria archaeon]|nr:hypothetical protein [Halobacteria archaeon]